VGRTSVEAVSEEVEAVGKDPAAFGKSVVSKESVVLGEAVVMEARRQTRRSGCARCGPSGCQQGADGCPGGGRGDGWRGSGGGSDGGQRGDDGAGVEVVEEQTCEWCGNDSSKG
jgi:hypothetical protein